MSDARLTGHRALEIGRTISSLRAKFVSNDRFDELAEQFDLLLYRRRADLEAGRQSEARGIVLTGNPGSGKSTAINRLFSRHVDLSVLSMDREQADIVSFQVPSPATLKFVGQSCLRGLGYPLSRDRPANVIWQLVQHHLKQRRTLFMHLDEAQDLSPHRGTNEVQSVVNTLKSIMQNSEWPVGIILTGTGSLRALVNHDPQLSRRLLPIEFRPICWSSHGKSVKGVIRGYSKSASLMCSDEVLKPELVKRLIHSGSEELGLVIELVISALEEALIREQSEITVDAFAQAFKRRSGCVDALNPFIAEDWRAMDARLLFQREVKAPVDSPFDTWERV